MLKLMCVKYFSEILLTIIVITEAIANVAFVFVINPPLIKQNAGNI